MYFSQLIFLRVLKYFKEKCFLFNQEFECYILSFGISFFTFKDDIVIYEVEKNKECDVIKCSHKTAFIVTYMDVLPLGICSHGTTNLEIEWSYYIVSEMGWHNFVHASGKQQSQTKRKSVITSTKQDSRCRFRSVKRIWWQGRNRTETPVSGEK